MLDEVNSHLKNPSDTLILKLLDLHLSHPHLPFHLGIFRDLKLVPPVRRQLQAFVSGYNFLDFEFTQSVLPGCLTPLLSPIFPFLSIHLT